MSTSHACGLEEGGMPKERYQRYHEEKAKGGIGLTMFGGSSNVAPDLPSVFQQLYVGDDEVIPYLQQFSERVHKYGAAIMCQITHLGRRGEPYQGPTMAAIRETLHHRKKWTITISPVRHSRNVTSKFLSPATNKRNGRSRYRPRVLGGRCAVDEAMKDGLSQEECIEVAHIFERDDFFNGNYGRMDTLLGRAVDNMPGMASIAPWLHAFKREVDLPLPSR